MKILCHECGDPIVRNLKRVQGLNGTLNSYHRSCLEERNKRRIKDVHGRSHRRAQKVDRGDDRRTAKQEAEPLEAYARKWRPQQ